MHLSTLLVAASSLPLLLATTLPVNELGQPAPSFLQSRTHYNSYCPPRHANAEYQKDIFFDFINVLYTEKNATKAFDTYVAVDLIEHDPFDAQGRAANAAKLSGIIPYANFEVLRQNFDSNIGLIHVRVNENPEPIALADIYRMNGTCIVEHWDVTQARPANATNPIAMF
jgi:predicted SnoaL-like aldol condensation-catalyzing enzyme